MTNFIFQPLGPVGGETFCSDFVYSCKCVKSYDS